MASAWVLPQRLEIFHIFSTNVSGMRLAFCTRRHLIALFVSTVRQAGERALSLVFEPCFLGALAALDYVPVSKECTHNVHVMSL